MNLEQEPKREILVVDDDEVFSLLASETLQQAGYAVLVVGTGEAALDILGARRPDLVLLDVELPDANGFDLCEGIRAASGADIPIVMVTGHNDTESIERAFLVGATDFIHKPVLWQTLPQRVGFILRAQDTLRSLKLSEQKNRALLQALPDTIYIVDGNGVLLEHITGIEHSASASLVGRSLAEVIPKDAADAARRTMIAPVDVNHVTTCNFETGQGPERRCFETRLRPQIDGTLVVITRDITERRRTESRIRYLAYFDTLTGLPNRQMLVRDMARAIRAAQKSGTLIALLYLDLDRFKRINDNLGHSVGDALLKAVGRRLLQSTRAGDVLTSPAAGATTNRGSVARLGGDEFVVLVTDLKEEDQATAVADRIREALGAPFECGGHRFVVTPSIGIALYPKDGGDIEDLLVKADMAMYKAKDQGRNSHAFYGETMAIRSLSRLELENDLARAFEAGDFQIFHQPKVDLATGRTVGVEALLRWRHAERGWISPEAFIPVAEECGLIVALGDWVLRETCRQLQRWAGTDLGHLTIAVNVSVQQFAREDFVDTVLRMLNEFDVRPHLLELEITESLLLRNVDDTTSGMMRFRAAGLTLSIDDFGTGYSSLGYLRSFPVHALKIDRSFVKDLSVKPDGGAICAAIIALARELKLRVIAEGVENLEQVEFLRLHRCDQVQGYLMSAPLPISELEDLLRCTPTGTRLLHHPGTGETGRLLERVAANAS